MAVGFPFGPSGIAGYPTGTTVFPTAALSASPHNGILTQENSEVNSTSLLLCYGSMLRPTTTMRPFSIA